MGVTKGHWFTTLGAIPRLEEVLGTPETKQVRSVNRVEPPHLHGMSTTGVSETCLVNERGIVKDGYPETGE